MFEEIYHKHKQLVFNLALQYTQNKEDAEEITQDVFVKIYDNLKHFKQQSEIKTWVYRIAVNQSLDFIKNKQRQKRSFLNLIFRIDDEDSHIEIPHFNHPAVELESKEKIQQIYSCLNRLPENQRTALILLKIEGLTQNETAAVMKLSAKAVESLFQRAKKNLENLLQQTEGK